MIGFRLSNGDVITLATNAKVEFELVSSLFSDDIPAAHSTAIQVADVDGNFRKLGLVNRLDLLNRVIQYSGVQMLVDGRPEYAGKLFVKRKNKNGVSCFFIPSGFAADIKDKNLVDVNYGSDITLGATTAAIVTAASGYVSQNYPTVSLNFPTLFAPEAYDYENAVAWRGHVNVDEWKAQDYAINDFVTLPERGGESVYRCILAAGPTHVPGNTTYWVKENGNALVNNWDDASSEFYSNDITGLETFNKHALSPQLYAKFVLSRIASTYGYGIAGEFMADENTDQLLVHNNVLLDRGQRTYYVRAEQDGVYDATQNPNGGSGVQIISATANTMVFNDETTAPNEDADSVFTLNALSRYTFQNAGTHTFTFYVTFSTNTAPGSTYVELYTLYNTTIINGADSLRIIPTAYTGLFEYTFTYDATPADVGNHVSPRIGGLSAAYYLAMDAGSYFIVENNAADSMNRYKGTIELAQHVPDVTVGDFLIGLKRRFNLNVIIDNRAKNIRLDYAKNLLTRAADDYTHILQGQTFDFKDPEGLTINESFNSGIEVQDGEGVTINHTVGGLADITDAVLASYEVGDVVHILSINTLASVGRLSGVVKGIVLLGNYYPPYVYGNGTRTLEMIGQPANMHAIFTDDDTVVVPRFDFRFSSDLFGQGRKDCPLVFSFWHGLTDAVDGSIEFPFASPHPYEPDGTAIANGIDLRFLNDSASVWELQHADWVRRVNESTVVFAKADMNVKQVFEWDFTKPIRHRYTNLVRSKLIYEIDQTGNIEAEVQAVKIGV